MLNIRAEMVTAPLLQHIQERYPGTDPTMEHRFPAIALTGERYDLAPKWWNSSATELTAEPRTLFLDEPRRRDIRKRLIQIARTSYLYVENQVFVAPDHSGTVEIYSVKLWESSETLTFESARSLEPVVKLNFMSWLAVPKSVIAALDALLPALPEVKRRPVQFSAKEIAALSSSPRFQAVVKEESDVTLPQGRMGKEWWEAHWRIVDHLDDALLSQPYAAGPRRFSRNCRRARLKKLQLI